MSIVKANSITPKEIPAPQEVTIYVEASGYAKGNGEAVVAHFDPEPMQTNLSRFTAAGGNGQPSSFDL